MKRFEESIAWEKSKTLNIAIYKVFRDCKDYSFKDQIQRASVSIVNNIAEGFERSGDKEFRHYLFVSKGSAGEVRSMLILAQELGYISKTDYQVLHDLSEEVSKILAGLIRKL